MQSVFYFQDWFLCNTRTKFELMEISECNISKKYLDLGVLQGLGLGLVSGMKTNVSVS